MARLATVGGTGPHLVPIVFCEIDGTLVVPIDGKPKSGSRLKRVENIRRNPAVSILIDDYSEDWSELRWARIDGRATIIDTDPGIRTALAAKYPQYEHTEVGTKAIRIEVERVASWSARERT